MLRSALSYESTAGATNAPFVGQLGSTWNAESTEPVSKAASQGDLINLTRGREKRSCAKKTFHPGKQKSSQNHLANIKIHIKKLQNHFEQFKFVTNKKGHLGRNCAETENFLPESRRVFVCFGRVVRFRASSSAVAG